MKQSKIVLVNDARYEVVGKMTFATVPGLLTQSQANFSSSAADITFDLKKVEHADSAGLALMLEWLRQARRVNKNIKFINTPSQLLNLTEITGLSNIITLSEA